MHTPCPRCGEDINIIDVVDLCPGCGGVVDRRRSITAGIAIMILVAVLTFMVTHRLIYAMPTIIFLAMLMLIRPFLCWYMGLIEQVIPPRVIKSKRQADLLLMYIRAFPRYPQGSQERLARAIDAEANTLSSES